MSNEPDDDPDSTVESTADTIGQKTGGALGTIAASLPKLIPRQSVLFRKMTYTALKNYHKRAGGDAIGLDAKPGQQIDFTPVKYRTAEECDEGERPGWKAKGEDKVWNAGSEGRVVDYIGDVPIVALDRDSHVETGWLRPRIGEAIELDQYGTVHTNSTINLVVDADSGGGAATNGTQPTGAAGAVTDGGSVPQLEVAELGPWAGDAVLDLDSGDGYDGMRISFRKATEWMAETTTSEQMQMQEDRGILKGQLGDSGPNVTRLFLYAALFALGTIALVLLGPEAIGGGSGGAGINPLMIDTLTATLGG